MHQTQWSPERPLPPPISLASQSHHEKPPEVMSFVSRDGNVYPVVYQHRRAVEMVHVAKKDQIVTNTN